MPDSLPPYDSSRIGPNQSIIALLTSGGQAEPVCAISCMLLTSVASRTAGSTASSRWKCVGTMTDEATSYLSMRSSTAAPSNFPTMTTGRPSRRWRTAVSGPLCCRGPTTMCAPSGNCARSRSLSRYSRCVLTGASTQRVWVPRARPVVPEV